MPWLFAQYAESCVEFYEFMIYELITGMTLVSLVNEIQV